MKIQPILMTFWSLLATFAGGAIGGLVFIENSAMQAIHMSLSDVETCIELYGTLTCDIHHIAGGQSFAMFATGAFVAAFCALPTILRFAVRFPDVLNLHPGFSAGVGMCLGAIAYVITKQLGLVGGFRFEDATAMCIFGLLSGFFAWVICKVTAAEFLRVS